jgi:hypothetical protein
MKIEFTIEQLGVVDRALQQLPYYLAAPLIADINKQIQEQQKVMDTPVDAAGMLSGGVQPARADSDK